MDNLKKIEERKAKKLKELENEIRNAEIDYLESVSKEITKDVLKEGRWILRAMYNNVFGLEGKFKSFPSLAKLLNGFRFGDRATIYADDIEYGISIGIDSIFICVMLNYDGKAREFIGNQEILPFIKQFELDVDFNEVEANLKLQEKNIKAEIEHLELIKKTQSKS